jgi:hypothetical protein
MARSTRDHGAVPVFLALDIVLPRPEHDPPSLRAASDSGMLVFDLLDVWRDRDVESLRVAPWDNHPNAAGNRLIAERLRELIQQHQRDIGIEPPAREAAVR